MGEHPQQSAASRPREPLSFSQLDRCFASLPEAIVVWDQAGMIRSLNAAACTLFEVTATDVVGTSVGQFLGRYSWWDEQHQPFFFASSLLDPAA